MLGTIISAAANLAGGLLGSKSAADANQANAKLQKQFAQNAIQWKSADALKAGIHPLFALGAPTMSFAPSTVGDTALPNALANMGQDIGRAIDAGGNAEDRAIRALQLERAGLENQLLRKQIAFTGSPPPSPVGARAVIPGQEQLDPIKIMGQMLPMDPDTSNMQTIENRYGDEGPGQWLGQLAVMAADARKGLWDAFDPKVQRFLIRMNEYVKRYGPYSNYK